MLTVVLVSLSSCRSEKSSFQFKTYPEFKKLHIDAVNEFERKRGSKNNTTKEIKGTFGLPKTFLVNEDPCFILETAYYCSYPDSVVTQVVYYWNYRVKSKGIKGGNDEVKKRHTIFQKKFDSIYKELSKSLGLPSATSLEQQDLEKSFFMDEIRWQSADGVTVLLRLSGNRKSAYRQVQLVWNRE